MNIVILRMELEPQRQNQDSQRTIFQGAELCFNQVADDICQADFTIAIELLWAFCIILHPIHFLIQLPKPKTALQLSIEPDFKLTRSWTYSQCCNKMTFSRGTGVREGRECILHVEGSELGKLICFIFKDNCSITFYFTCFFSICPCNLPTKKWSLFLLHLYPY